MFVAAARLTGSNRQDAARWTGRGGQVNSTSPGVEGAPMRVLWEM